MDMSFLASLPSVTFKMSVTAEELFFTEEDFFAGGEA